MNHFLRYFLSLVYMCFPNQLPDYFPDKHIDYFPDKLTNYFPDKPKDYSVYKYRNTIGWKQL